MKYSRSELINNVCEKSYRGSLKNQEKLINCGIEQGKKYDLGNNIWIAFFANHHGISKMYYWGERIIKKRNGNKKSRYIKIIRRN